MIENLQKSEQFSEAVQKLEAQKAQLDKFVLQLFRALNASQARVPSDIQTGINGTLTGMQRELKSLSNVSKGLARQLANLQGLVRTSALITSSLDLDHVLQEVMDTIIALTGAERAYLMLHDSQTDELTLRAARNWDQENLTAREAVFSRGVIDEAIKQGKPIVTLNAQDDERFQNRQSVAANQLRSILCIPLILQDETVGVLYTDNRAQLGLFDEDTVPMMSAFASQAAIAIVNARRFQSVKTDLEKVQREVQRLRIQIDQGKLDEQVDEIVETDYFKFLEERADEMRNQYSEG